MAEGSGDLLVVTVVGKSVTGGVETLEVVSGTVAFCAVHEDSHREQMTVITSHTLMGTEWRGDVGG